MAYFIDGIPYNKEEYEELRIIIDNRPEDTFESVYRLNHETKMYEGFERTREEKIDWYIETIDSGNIILEDVPEEYYAEVEIQIQHKTDQE